MPSHTQRSVSIWAISLVAVGFGLLTIKEGGAVLFGFFGAYDWHSRCAITDGAFP